MNDNLNPTYRAWKKRNHFLFLRTDFELRNMCREILPEFLWRSRAKAIEFILEAEFPDFDPEDN